MLLKKSIFKGGIYVFNFRAGEKNNKITKATKAFDRRDETLEWLIKL